uniref:(California timema) hypothetical protein n=1 Tax=Timema californicum TaxID=61474 RepID=A0A7R9P4Z5_TIMCA|nr:unnamed protein product [Timema californicum]
MSFMQANNEVRYIVDGVPFTRAPSIHKDFHSSTGVSVRNFSRLHMKSSRKTSDTLSQLMLSLTSRSDVVCPSKMSAILAIIFHPGFRCNTLLNLLTMAVPTEPEA